MTSEQKLEKFEEGDKIEVSARDTEMEIDSINTTKHGGIEMEASNRHGTYRIADYGDGNVGLRRDSDNKHIESGIEVKFAEDKE
jgi:hypothetical protein